MVRMQAERENTSSMLPAEYRCFYQRGGLVKQSGSSIIFSTFLVEDKLWYVPSANASSCDKDGSRWLPDATYNTVRYAVGHCIYRRKRHWMPVKVENQVLVFWHGWSTARVGSSGSLPKTVVRRKGNLTDLHVFPPETLPSLNMSEWLSLAGVDLDKRLDQQPWVLQNKGQGDVIKGLRGNGTDSKGATTNEKIYPYARISGLQLIFEAKYYNYRMQPRDKKHKKPKDERGDVVCILEVTPVLVYAGGGSNIQYFMNNLNQPDFVAVSDAQAAKSAETPQNATWTFGTSDIQNYGVVVNFQAGGAIGKFEFRSLLQSLLQGSVLLGIAHTVCTMLAVMGLGVASTLYQEFMKEKCDYKKEYARFAAQAVVAGSLFMQMDQDGTGTLDSSEIYKTLRKLLGEQLDKEELVKLTDFLLRHGDQDDSTNKRMVKKSMGDMGNTISLAEWVDIFTDDKACVQSLKRIIKSEYKGVQLSSAARDLAQRRTTDGNMLERDPEQVNHCEVDLTIQSSAQKRKEEA